MPSTTLATLLAALPPEQAPTLIDCTLDTLVGEPTDDSRVVAAGSCFIAVPGRTHDGHGFLDRAAAAGASLLIVQRGRASELPAKLARVELDDTAAALPRLAAAWWGWPGEHMRLAGVTGTNGKTTTAHLLAAVFDAAGRPHLRLGTTGNWLVDHEVHAGFTTPFPLELQRLLGQALALGAHDAVMEVSSHALDQGRVDPLRYRAVGLTSFSQDHLDYHPTMADYLAAKCKLAGEHLDPLGVAVAPREQGEAAIAFLRSATRAGCARAWSTSRGDHPDAAIAAIERRPGAGLAARVRTPIGELELRSPLVGEFNLDNLLVTIGLAIGLDVPLAAIAAGLARSQGAPGRLQAVRIDDDDRGPRVYVDYAHTPDAVERAIEALRPSTRGRLIVVLGCGGDRDPGKRPQMGAIASRGAEILVATSDNPRTEDPEAILDQMLAGAVAGATIHREVDRARAIAWAIAEAREDDDVLIAGKGHEDYQILGTRKIHFDDREQAEAALRARG
ncbi:UDP-N-acetylmuramoyl-L-alanyl-D-glutamate--2,6-diaminopimelate ligase [Nannocystaceae bacterium ST9]